MTQPQVPTGNAVRVILVPYPVSPLATFAYYILGEMGNVTPFVSYRWNRPDENEDTLARTCLFGRNLFRKVWSWIDKAPIGDKKLLRRLLNFCQQPDIRQRKTLQDLQRSIACTHGSPREVLAFWASYWERVVRYRIDPVHEAMPPFPNNGYVAKPDMAFEGVWPIKWPRPKFEGEDEQKRPKLVGSDKFTLELNQARFLSGHHLTIGAFGPAGVGKSSLIASMTYAMQCWAESISAWPGWEGFQVKVDCLDLDLGTPTLTHILNGKGQNRELLEQSKRTWTPEMVAQALWRLDEARRKSNVLLVDLPGKRTEVLEALGSSLDGGILATPSGDPEAKNIWANYLRKELALGEELVDASCKRDEAGERSFARTHHHHHTARGQVTDMKRVILSWDPFITYSAMVLLFDLLPGLVHRRRDLRARYTA